MHFMNWRTRNRIIAFSWIAGISLCLGFVIYYMADHNLFPTSCSGPQRSENPCEPWDTDRTCSAKILAKGLQENRQAPPYDSSNYRVIDGATTATKKTSTIKLSDTQFVIVEYQSACNVTFESAKLAKLEQP